MDKGYYVFSCADFNKIKCKNQNFFCFVLTNHSHLYLKKKTDKYPAARALVGLLLIVILGCGLGMMHYSGVLREMGLDFGYTPNKRIHTVAAFVFAAVVIAFDLCVDRGLLSIIVIPDDAAETVNLAANDLRDFIGRYNGTNLVIADKALSERGNIFICGHEDRLDDVPVQGFRIIGKVEILYIISDD